MKVSGEYSPDRGEDKKKSGHAMACAGSQSYEWCGQILRGGLPRYWKTGLVSLQGALSVA